MKTKIADVTLLRLDHPGANNQAYLKRRKFIASRARASSQNTIRDIRYHKSEHLTWKLVSTKIAPLHSQWACSAYLAAKKELGMPIDRIPQLRKISSSLQTKTGFRLAPIEGLVDPKSFLSKLGERVMLSTQYIRHSSRPDYTPEPDIVHELIGHAPMFLNNEFADFSERIGKAAQQADARQIQMLERLYWFTVEFGLIREGKETKAFGAGLLSSFGELESAFSGKPKLKAFDVRTILKTPYNYSTMQRTLFVIPSFTVLKNETDRFLKTHAL